MVNASVASVLADFADADDFEFGSTSTSRTSDRFASQKREQPSSVRLASQSRHSRKRSAKSTAPAGPRRRLYKG